MATNFNLRLPVTAPEQGFSEEVSTTLVDLNEQLVKRDKSVQATLDSLQAQITAFVAVPTGTMMPFGGSSAPTGYLLCDGSSISKTTYSTLHGVIGYTFGGSGDNFNLPDMRRRVPMGAGGTSISGPANTVGSSGGAETHQLTIAEMPSHDHGILVGSSSPNAICMVRGSFTSSAGLSQGGDSAHTNVQPSLVVNYIIKT